MSEHERLVSAGLVENEDDVRDLSLRPRTFKQYIGQKMLKKELAVYIEAAKKRKEALDHVLLYGPPGLGKTTLAMVIANELQVKIKTTSGPAIERPGDLVALLNELEAGDVLFIDEIHRLPKIVEEILYSAMEDFFVDIVIGQGPTAHPVHFTLPPFTLIGATTRAGLLSAPLRDRFGIIAHMNYYSKKELERIVERSAKIFKTTITSEGAEKVALRSRGTPRVANRLFRRIRDFAEVAQKEVVDEKIVTSSLDMLRVDECGLDETDRKLLLTMINLYDGGPVGVNTLAANIGEDVETITDMIEPYLLQSGFIKRTPRGRIATKTAYEHLGISFTENKN
ncbi:Holliday junction branch migration DNA helicase RuvB [Liquorilactobacillus oeni]|uniref:Holliday junction branch migration complex subunit RuvB n=1 Tax=Liquorilactobacillus oeni DSM 19972 TaxID=1423777 RepID=A0A0R1MA17_9LACO|nr:Holliday junction branch migration DNA helicase RuvB [Liquorilactobacillus oeni]KRL04974.1 Holliday junction DNA helicase RuvB [Liquorilactobacillus oeni DSM 19972]